MLFQSHWKFQILKKFLREYRLPICLLIFLYYFLNCFCYTYFVSALNFRNPFFLIRTDPLAFFLYSRNFINDPALISKFLSVKPYTLWGWSSRKSDLSLLICIFCFLLLKNWLILLLIFQKRVVCFFNHLLRFG